MRYLMLVCWDAEKMDAQTEPDPTDTPDDEGFPWLDDLQARGIWVTGDQLAPPRRARSVRVRNGRSIVTDGPFAETKEAVGGFDVIECGSVEEAVEIAAAHPIAQMGTIEVRPLWRNSTFRLRLPTRRRVAAAVRRRGAAASCPTGRVPRRRSRRRAAARWNRRDENGSIARDSGSASARADGVRMPTISASWRRHGVSAGTRPTNGWTRQPVARVSSGGSVATISTVAGESPTSSSASRSAVASEIGVARLGLPAGKPELAAVQPAVVGPDDEDDPQVAVRVPVDRKEHGGRRAARPLITRSWRRRSSIVSRRRMTRASPSRTSTAAGRVTPL